MFLLISELQWWDPSHQNASHVGKEKKNRNSRSTKKGLEAAWKPTVYFSPTKKGCLLGWFAIWSGGNSRVIMQNLSETHINVAIAHTGILHAGILHIQFHIWWFPYGGFHKWGYP
jgi:hypothetical protein